MLEPIVIRLNDLPRDSSKRAPTSQPITPPAPAVAIEPDPLRVLPRVNSIINATANMIVAAEAERKTQEELNAARHAPDDSPGLTLAEQRRRFEREAVGPSLIECEISGQTLFAKRFNFGETLYLTLLLPLGETGFLDPAHPDEIAFAMAEMLRLGLCRDGSGTPYFDNRGDAVAYVDDDSTAEFAGAAVMFIDSLNRLFPKRPTQAAAPRPTRAQERLERLRAQSEASAQLPNPAPESKPKRARKTTKDTQTQTPKPPQTGAKTE